MASIKDELVSWGSQSPPDVLRLLVHTGVPATRYFHEEGKGYLFHIETEPGCSGICIALAAIPSFLWGFHIGKNVAEPVLTAEVQKLRLRIAELEYKSEEQ